MIKILVGSGLSTGLTGFVDAWKKAQRGEALNERVLSFETSEALERYFSEIRPAEEVQAYRHWQASKMGAGETEAGAAECNGPPESAAGANNDEAPTIQDAVSLGRASAAGRHSKSHAEISEWLRTWGRESPTVAEEEP